ncbi:TPA: GNAT family N-acetyltransferase [Klebsiella pneumoniae]|nr:GNAT family N-acetyltransferase [Klebsiella pneumoniae]
MHIRAYRDSDLPLLCQIFLGAVRETASRDYTPGQIAAWAQVDETRWRQKLADSIGLVAVVNSQPVGFITAIGTHIDLLFVSPDRARQGIGGALIEALCVQYPAQILTVDASITAKPCFTAHGFKVVAEQRVAARGEWFINYRMEKRVALR